MRFVKESIVRAAPGEVFAFHESAGALERLTPPWERVEIVSGGGSLAPGTRVVIRSRVGPIPIVWVAEHVEYEPDRMFSDRQVSGPFRSWFHRHHFLPAPDGGTILRDEVEYEVRLGRVGRLLAGGVVRRKLKRLFDFRHEATRRSLESPGL